MKATSTCGWLLTLPLVLLTGCTDPAKTISAGSYRNAVERGLATELHQRGIILASRPECHTTRAESIQLGGRFTLHCTSSTTDGKPMVTDGEVTGAGTGTQQESYRIRIGGEELLRTECLGAGCRQEQ